MSKMIIEVELDNASFYDDNNRFDGHHLVKMLRSVADEVESGDYTRGRVQDFNGNTCGTWRFVWD